VDGGVLNSAPPSCAYSKVDKVRKSTQCVCQGMYAGGSRDLYMCRKLSLTLLKNPDVLTRNSTKDELAFAPFLLK
jgi:hypothetical protein